MRYDFYADKDDKLKILHFIFNETDLTVYDLSSEYDSEICEYKTVDEILSKFDLDFGEKFAVTFQLWSPRHEGKPICHRITLDPKRCKGHTFRYSTNGWGLIQLYFGGCKNNNLNLSHIGHFNEKGALVRQEYNSINGQVSQWNWKEITSTSRRLKNYIRKNLVTRNIRTLGVLQGADNLEKQGIKMI